MATDALNANVKCQELETPAAATNTNENGSESWNQAVVLYTKGEDPSAETDEILVKICSGDRKKKKAFMSFPSRKDVIDKANKFGLNGTTLVLESDGCEICEDKVLVVFANDKSLLMLLEEDEEYIPLTQTMKVSNANDSTLSNDETISLVCNTPNGSTTTKSSPQFLDFDIPWHKVSDNIMKPLREKKKLGKRINALASFLVEELSDCCGHITVRILKQVAQQAAEKYPESLLEKDYDGLISKMINLYNSLKKSKKRASVGFFVPHNPTKKRKSTNTVSNPNDEINSVLLKGMEEKKILLSKSHDNIETLDRETIINYMKVCFPLQRAFFNNVDKIPDIAAIKDNWPYIFDREILYHHFELLMSINPSNLENNFKTEKERIFNYFKNSEHKKISALDQSDQNILRSIAFHFNEDPDYIFKYFEHGTSSDSVKDANPTNAPWIALVKNELSTSENDFTATIFIEGREVAKCNSGICSFADIITQLLCYFFTFNMMYPKEATQTLEFVVIYFLKADHNRGTKIATGNRKFNQLITKLSNTNF